jgi:hypothetical protein
MKPIRRYYTEELVCDTVIIDKWKISGTSNIVHMFYSQRLANEVCDLMNKDNQLSMDNSESLIDYGKMNK